MEDTDRNKMADFSARIRDLTPGTSGAYSLREGEKILISPSAVPYAQLDAESFAVVTPEGRQISTGPEPSSETPMILSIYRELPAHAVVHVHSPWATAKSTLGEPLKFVHYAAALAGSEVPVAGYKTFGTEDLAEEVIDVLNDSDSRACLMANHGQVAYGNSLEEAFRIAEAIEFTARVECQARSVGSPRELSDEEIQSARKRFRRYGQPGDDPE